MTYNKNGSMRPSTTLSTTFKTIDIADVCGLNRSYFGKIFKNAVGKTPQEFLLNYRMLKATELLKLTRLSIRDVSNAVGYANPLHFSRAFRNIYGIPPRE